MTQSEQSSETPIQIIRPTEGKAHLEISWTKNYDLIYTDENSHAKMDVIIRRPLPADTSYFIIGDYAQGNHGQAVGSAPVVKAIDDDPKNPLIKRPVGYDMSWNDHGTKTTQSCSIWYPKPPDGYVSIGYVANNAYPEPTLKNYACLRRDLVGQIDSGSLIWEDKGSHADLDVWLYEIIDYPHTFLAKSTYEPHKIPRNDFRLNMTGLSDFTFDVKEHSVNGPWEGVTCKSDRTGATITAHVERDGSAVTAEWFKQAIGEGSAIGCQTIDKLPGNLNFAFKGTMSFTHGGSHYEGRDIVIGQGHTGFSRNNWWIGGPNMTTSVDLPVGVLSVLSQSFGVGTGTRFLPTAKVIFTVVAFDVSSMTMTMLAIA
jgi:hypothetical protein